MKHAKKSYLLALATLISNFAWAIEIEQSVDLSLKFVPSWQPELTIGSLTVADHYQTNAQTDAFWNINAYLTDALTLNARYGLAAAAILDQAGSSHNSGSAEDFRLDDLPSEIDPTYHQTLDLLNVSFYSQFGDYVIGRQAISFGQAKFFSPIDVIYPKTLFAIDSNYRPGVDAMRVTWPLGATSELDGGALFGEETGGFLRYKTNILNADWEAIGIQLNRDNAIMSLGTNGGVGSIGLWQESAWLLDQAADQSWLRSTIGADYTFFDDWYVAGELHYNGIGEVKNYALNSEKSFYQLGSVIPQGRWYSSVQLSYPINIVTAISVGATVNLNDYSSLLNSALRFDASDSLTINASLLVPMAADYSDEYEYGVYPFSGVIKLDWVF
ncbi:MAG: hypothetical protein P8X74_06250 [Reinekea sp.]|jgi:hypothetical protein